MESPFTTKPSMSSPPYTPQSELNVSGAFSDTAGTTSHNNQSSRTTQADTLQSMLNSGSMVLQQAEESSCWRPPIPTGDGAVPYLDIMVVNSAQYPFIGHHTTNPDDYGTHTRLLIEPISIPSLKHTGVTLRPLPTELNRQRAKVPLFYPDGGKSVQLRHNIRNTLKNPINMRGMNGAVDLDSMEHWNRDGGSRVLATPDSVNNKSSSNSTKRRLRKSKKNGSGSGSKSKRREGGPMSSVRSSRAGAKQRTAETRDVLNGLHGTLERMDSLTGRR